MVLALRSALYLGGKFVLTVVYGLILLPLYFLPKSVRHRVIVFWCYLAVMWLRVTCGVRYKVIGGDLIRSDLGARVFLSKHQSTWETFMLQVLLFPSATILKKELLKIPIFGWGLSFLQPIPIDRSNPREALKMVKQGGLARLNSGINLLLFPEGTRTLPGERVKYARSGADIAIAAGVDVIPIAVNAGHCWPSKTFVKTPGLIHIVVGEPISSKGKTSRDLIAEVETWIESTMAKLDAPYTKTEA